ncbi:MAG: hypothetical protein NTY53_08965 [Kiritimatiellaeota bacterium]|nr:hypothetical protein [Kiritimatiellota bacterium]
MSGKHQTRQPRFFHKLTALPDDHARVNRLCELNVIRQVTNVARTTVARDAWARGQEFTIHGWIYNTEDGLIRDLGVSRSAPAAE